MATLPTQNITRLGLVPTFTAAAGGGDAMECGDGMQLRVKNGSGSPITVTLAIPAALSQWPNVAYTNTAVVVAAGADATIGPIPAGLYRDLTTGLCTITYSATTSVTVAAVKLATP